MSRVINLAEVRNHATVDSAWMIIHNNVYDLTKFLDEHPGGADSLLEYAGQDGTQAFEDVGHSDDARELMKKFEIGTLPVDEQTNGAVTPTAQSCDTATLLKKEVLVLAAHRSPTPRVEPKQSCEPRIERRVPAIIVPRERRRRRPLTCPSPTPPPPPPPESGSRLKWALIALAGALLIGFALRKYAKGTAPAP